MTRRNWESVFGYFLPGDCRALQSLCGDKDVLEIGCLYGKSTLCIASVAKSVTTVDTFKAHDNGVDQMKEFTTLETFIKNIKGYDNITYLIGRSEEVVPAIEDEFDVVFVDGWHKYEQVKLDIEVSWPKLKKGGIMAFHDFHTYANDVGRAVKELGLDINFPGGDTVYLIKSSKKYPFGKPKKSEVVKEETIEDLEKPKDDDAITEDSGWS